MINLNKLNPVLIYYSQTHYKTREFEVLVEFQMLYETQITRI